MVLSLLLWVAMAVEPSEPDLAASLAAKGAAERIDFLQLLMAGSTGQGDRAQQYSDALAVSQALIQRGITEKKVAHAFLAAALEPDTRDTMRAVVEAGLDLEAGFALLQGVPPGKALAEAFYVDGDPRLAAYAPPVSPRLSGGDLQSYRKTVARQDGWVVGVAGDTSPVHARELADAVRDHLGGGPAVPVQALPELRPTATRPARVVVYDKGLTEGTFVWATEGLALSDPRAAAGLVAAEALRLAVVDEVRHRRGDTYAISAEGLLQPAPGVFVLTTHTEPSRAPDHIEAVESVLQSVATGGLSEQHIARARDRISGMAQTASSSPVGRLTLAVQRQLARDDASMSAVVEQVPQVSDAEVMSFAEAWGSGRWTQASLLPTTAR